MHRLTTHVTKNKAIAVTRKLARDLGGGQKTPIGPEYLAAGILKAMGNDAQGLLSDFGIPTVVEGLRKVPDAAPEEAERLPSAVPDEALGALLNGRLKPFVEGKADPKSALKLLLAEPGVAKALQALFQQPRYADPASCVPITEILRMLTRNLHTGYLLGMKYYSPMSNTGLSDYVSGRNDGAFSQAVREFYAEKHRVRATMYCTGRGQRRSIFDRYMRNLGPVAADVAFTVMVNALTPFTENGRPISVREVGWALDPVRYHVIVGDVIEATKSLKQNYLIRILPEEDHCQLFSVLLPSEHLMDEFTGYISTRYDALEDLMTG